MQQLAQVQQPETKEPLDVRRFGRCYWFAMIYGTLVWIFLPLCTPWLFAALKGACLFLPLQMGFSSIWVTAHDLRTARQTGDRNALIGNILAVLIHIVTAIASMVYIILYLVQHAQP